MPVDDAGAQQAYDAADRIVTVEPVLFSKGWGGSSPTVRFKIHETLKGGPLPDEINAAYNANAAMCGVDLQAGERYTLGLYDLYTPQAGQDFSGRYRVMSSCQQAGITHYLQNTRAGASGTVDNDQPEKDQ